MFLYQNKVILVDEKLAGNRDIISNSVQMGLNCDTKHDNSASMCYAFNYVMLSFCIIFVIMTFYERH